MARDLAAFALLPIVTVKTAPQWFGLHPLKTRGWSTTQGITVMIRILRPATGAPSWDGVSAGYWVSAADNTTVGFSFADTLATIHWTNRRNTDSTSNLNNSADTNIPLTLCAVTLGTNTEIHQNGKWKFSSTSSGTVVDFSSIPLTAGVSTGNAYVRDKFFSAMWNRALTPNEIASMHANPYQFLTR
jgi:hypothetical protein